MSDIHENWVTCPHCGARIRKWDSWWGCTLWAPDWTPDGDGGLAPVERYSFCPNCGRRLDDADGS